MRIAINYCKTHCNDRKFMVATKITISFFFETVMPGNEFRILTENQASAAKCGHLVMMFLPDYPNFNDPEKESF